MFNHIPAEVARSWIGTPFRHQTRIRGKCGGVDCWNLVRAVAEEAYGKHITPQEFAPFNGYARVPQDGMLTAALNRFFVLLDRIEPQVGDIALMASKPGRDPKHCAIVGSVQYSDKQPRLTLIHSSLIYKGCVEHRLTEEHRSHIVALYGFE